MLRWSLFFSYLCFELFLVIGLFVLHSYFGSFFSLIRPVRPLTFFGSFSLDTYRLISYTNQLHPETSANVCILAYFHLWTYIPH